MAKMQLLPGVTSQPIKEIHDACEDTLDAREKAAEARKLVNDCQANVGKLLHKHGLKRYKQGGVKAAIVSTDRVTVDRTSKKELKA